MQTFKSNAYLFLITLLFVAIDQKNRVENICDRLGMTSLAYLWERNQPDLLQEMINSGIHAILIKVACLGLKPDKHLGKTLTEMKPYLIKLQDEFGKLQKKIFLKDFKILFVFNFLRRERLWRRR